MLVDEAVYDFQENLLDKRPHIYFAFSANRLELIFTTKEKETMSQPEVPGIIFYDNGFVRTHYKSGKLIKPTFKYESFPIPNKSDDRENSSDKSKK